MDKNRIHIDDLVRSRLSGAEEKEPAGAWSSMRDLLDKEMPVQTASFNWRRMLGYASALLLATSVSVGGYNYYRHTLDTRANDLPIAGNASSNHSANNNKVRNETNVVSLATVAANSTHQIQPNHTPSSTPLNKEDQIAAPVSISGNKPTISANAPHHSTAASGSDTESSKTDNQSSTAALVASSGSSLGKPAAAIPSGRELNSNSSSENKINPTTSAAQGTNKPQQSTGTSALAGQANATPAEPSSIGNQPSNQQPKSLATVAGNAIKGTANNPNSLAANKPATTLVKDTIRQIEIVYRRMIGAGSSKQYKKDTIAITNLVIEKQKTTVMPQLQKQTTNPSVNTSRVPAPAKPRVSAKANPAPATVYSAPVPQAAAVSNAAAMAATDNIKLVSLSEFRIASRFRNLWNAARFNAMVENMKADFSRAQFYAGITGGINASVFSGTAMAGFQAGLTGLLAFNEQWSIAGELKFYQRFNTGKSIQDNYVKQEDWIPGNYTTVNGVQYREWNWKQDTVAHSYNFTTVQTIELPLMLRYNAGRLFAEAGLNMMYAFGINAEEIDKPNGNSTAVSRQMPASFTPESVSGNKPSIHTNDFNARFGLGYALGLGYQITPALQANCRLVHSVWDNANSVGGQKVSRNLYQTPSIQFSIGYRFKQGKGR